MAENQIAAVAVIKALRHFFKKWCDDISLAENLRHRANPNAFVTWLQSRLNLKHSEDSVAETVEATGISESDAATCLDVFSQPGCGGAIVRFWILVAYNWIENKHELRSASLMLLLRYKDEASATIIRYAESAITRRLSDGDVFAMIHTETPNLANTFIEKTIDGFYETATNQGLSAPDTLNELEQLVVNSNSANLRQMFAAVQLLKAMYPVGVPVQAVEAKAAKADTFPPEDDTGLAG